MTDKVYFIGADKSGVNHIFEDVMSNNAICGTKDYGFINELELHNAQPVCNQCEMLRFILDTANDLGYETIVEYTRALKQKKRKLAYWKQHNTWPGSMPSR